MNTLLYLFSILQLITSLLLPGVVKAQLSVNLAITEIAYDLPGSDEGHEWLELSNNSASSLDLTGWSFVDTAKHNLDFSAAKGATGGSVLIPGQYAIIASDAKVFLTDHPGYSGVVIDTVMSLPNDTSTPFALSLTDPAKTVLIMVSYKSVSGITPGRTLERQPDWPTDQWQISESLGGSPGLPLDQQSPQPQPSPAPIMTNQSVLRITEVMANPSGTDAGHEWLELYNPSGQLIDLTGTYLENTAHQKHLLGGTIEVLSYVQVIADDFSITNNSEQLSLFDASTSLIDQVDISNAKETQSWSLIDSVWQWSDQPTPALPNLPSLTKLTSPTGSNVITKPIGQTQVSPTPKSNKTSQSLNAGPKTTPKITTNPKTNPKITPTHSPAKTSKVTSSTKKASPKVSPTRSPKQSPLLIMSQVAGVSQHRLPITLLLLILIVGSFICFIVACFKMFGPKVETWPTKIKEFALGLIRRIDF